MSGMGDRVPPQYLPGRVALVLIDLMVLTRAGVDELTARDLYESLDMQGWIDTLEVPKGSITVPWKPEWDDLPEWQQQAWGDLAWQWREFLHAHIDEDALTEIAYREVGQ